MKNISEILKKGSMVYIIHIDWSWIKQRPQFLALELLEYFSITLLFPKSFKKKEIVKSKKPAFVRAFRKLPMQRFKDLYLFQVLNKKFISLQLRSHLKESEYIWLTCPEIYDCLKGAISANQKVIYDCMDDFLEFPSVANNTKRKHKLALNEQELMLRANFVFSSSMFLKNKLKERYKEAAKNVQVINNAISEGTLVEGSKNTSFVSRGVDDIKNIVYIGTISEWFDFKLLVDALEVNQNVRFILIGPREVAIPAHSRLVYHGIVEHKDVLTCMDNSDALIMPFIVNDLIKSVNPVKLYEYIRSLKPIITCFYPEIENFRNLVYSYRNKNEFYKLLESLTLNELRPIQSSEALDFLAKNTWKIRCSQVIEIITK